MRHMGYASPAGMGRGDPHMHVSAGGCGQGGWGCSGPAAGAHAAFAPHPRKGRRPTLILRTQLSVRVHAIIGELGMLLPPGWRGSGSLAPPGW